MKLSKIRTDKSDAKAIDLAEKYSKHGIKTALMLIVITYDFTRFENSKQL
jgi:hypothetical protein